MRPASGFWCRNGGRRAGRLRPLLPRCPEKSAARATRPWLHQRMGQRQHAHHSGAVVAGSRSLQAVASTTGMQRASRRGIPYRGARTERPPGRCSRGRLAAGSMPNTLPACRLMPVRPVSRKRAASHADRACFAEGRRGNGDQFRLPVHDGLGVAVQPREGSVHRPQSASAVIARKCRVARKQAIRLFQGSRKSGCGSAGRSSHLVRVLHRMQKQPPRRAVGPPPRGRGRPEYRESLSACSSAAARRRAWFPPGCAPCGAETVAADPIDEQARRPRLRRSQAEE